MDTFNKVPNDVYQIVADKALENAKDSNAKAMVLAVKVNELTNGALFGRKTSKRSVMTLPYGVSQRSSTKYVVETVNEVVRKHEVVITTKELKLLRSVMGKLIWKAISEVISTPIVAKDYLQAIAKRCASQGHGLMWVTPTGLPVVQNLKERDVKGDKIQVKVKVLGEVTTVERRFPKYTNNLDGKSQANAFAPNYVHSFDSAHLQMTINAAAEEGMDNFLVVHDSFATDAKSAGRFNEIIREQFVEMYKGEDHLNDFHDSVLDLGVDLGIIGDGEDDNAAIERMQQGDFDLDEVLESEFFFA